MNSRSTVALVSAALLGFAIVLAFRFLDSAPEPANQSQGARHAPGNASAVTPNYAKSDGARPAAARVSQTTGEPAAAAPKGHAAGDIHFVQQIGREAKGARIDIHVKAALGLWEPTASRMRILLLEAEPKSDQIAPLLSSMQSDTIGESGGRLAMMELKFVPTAQAFDRNELDSAMLMARDGALSSTADVLVNIEWSGSLPSPQLDLPPGSAHPTIALTSDGDIVMADSTTWRQKWRLSLDVPVVMRQ